MKGPDELEQVIRRMNLPYTPADLQKHDALEAYTAARYGLFYEVGVGKTLVSTLTALLWDLPYNIVICPPILNLQWSEWLKSIGETDVHIFAGPKRRPEELDHKWVMMSHNIFRDSFTIIQDRYADRHVALIVDEAQAMKNPASRLFRCVSNFVGASRCLLMLTATPTSKPEDTYPYMKLKTPKLYRSAGHWENVHAGERDFYGKITEYKNLDALARNFGMLAVFRSKKEVYGDTLDPIFQVIPYDLSAKHAKLYRKLGDEQLLLLPNGDKIDATSSQALRHKMQQIIVNFAAFSGNPDDRSATLDVLDQVIEEVDPMNPSKSKLAVWTYYQSSSKLIYDYLVDKLGAEAVVIAYGASNSQKAVDRIMNDPATRVIVAQPKSVGVGLNLQHVCWEMVFLEMSTVPMDAKQAIGRVDRAGQKNRPTIRMAQARRTVHGKLFRDLLNNDALTSKVEQTPKTLRAEIFGE